MQNRRTVNKNDGSKKAQIFSNEEKLAGLEWANSVYSPGRYHNISSDLKLFICVSVKVRSRRYFWETWWNKKF